MLGISSIFTYLLNILKASPQDNNNGAYVNNIRDAPNNNNNNDQRQNRVFQGHGVRVGGN